MRRPTKDAHTPPPPPLFKQPSSLSTTAEGADNTPSDAVLLTKIDGCGGNGGNSFADSSSPTDDNSCSPRSPDHKKARSETPLTSSAERDSPAMAAAKPFSSKAPGGQDDKDDEYALKICICQREPKIPRPRNAFIMYRQAEQRKIVDSNPGLANPEISKIIGERWHKENEAVKNKWKSLADQEKIRHQQQYPTYRYQPRRNVRRRSGSPDSGGSGSGQGERPRCQKCGGVTSTGPVPSTHGNIGYNTTIAPWPATNNNNIINNNNKNSSSNTPVTRTLPVFEDLDIEGATRTFQHHRPSSSPVASSAQYHQGNDGGDNNNMSLKRRGGIAPSEVPYLAGRPNHHQATNLPAAGNRYPAAAGQRFLTPTGGAYAHSSERQMQQSCHSSHYQYSHAPLPMHSASRDNSVPGFRPIATANGTADNNPARSVTGYHQQPPPNEIGYDQAAYERSSLTLPPLRSDNRPTHHGPMQTTTTTQGAVTHPFRPAAAATVPYTFRQQIAYLAEYSHPAPRTNTSGTRGPLIAIEGADPDTAAQLAEQLNKAIKMYYQDLGFMFTSGPEINLAPGSSKTDVASRCHQLSYQWLSHSDQIAEALVLAASTGTPASCGLGGEDVTMTDGTDSPASKRAQTPASTAANKGGRGSTKDDADEDDEDEERRSKRSTSSSPRKSNNNTAERRDKPSSSSQRDSAAPPDSPATTRSKPGSSTKSDNSPAATTNTSYSHSHSHSSSSSSSAAAALALARRSNLGPLLNPIASTATTSPLSSSSPSSSSASAHEIRAVVIPNYSLFASRTLATYMPLSPSGAAGKDGQQRAANENWCWVATQWRGILGPDLTIYIDELASSSAGAGVGSAGGGGNAGGGVLREVVSGGREPHGTLFVVVGGSLGRDGAGEPLEASVLRRLAFEVAEFVREFVKG